MFRRGVSVILHVSDLKASADFYEYVLNFTFTGYLDEDGNMVMDWDDAKNPQAAEFRAGDTDVTLQLDESGEVNGASVEHTLEVINIDTFYHRVVERGGAATELAVQPWGRKEFYLTDSDGHAWTFYKPLQSATFGH